MLRIPMQLRALNLASTLRQAFRSTSSTSTAFDRLRIHTIVPSALEESKDIETDDPEGFNSKTKRDNKLRYFVANNQAAEAIDLLERSVFKIPVVISNVGEPKILKLPPPSTCNFVLVAATSDPKLLGKAAQLAVELEHAHDISLAPETLQRLLHALAKAGNATWTTSTTPMLELMETWLNKHEDILADETEEPPPEVVKTLEALLKSAVQSTNMVSALQVLSLMSEAGVVPSSENVMLLADALEKAGKMEAAQAVLSWIQKHQL